MEKKINETQKKTIFFIALAIFLIVAFWFTNSNEESLNSNREFTIGKVTKFNLGIYGFIDYEYYVDGLLIKGSDTDEGGGWPSHYRTAKPIIDKYYNVEYDSKNPTNSKIIIGKRSYFDYELPDLNGVQIKGTVKKFSAVSEDYLDLYIKYEIYGKSFSFRSRFHKDSLPCKDNENCLNSEVDLKVAKLYPELSDLYFQSYDRIAMRKSKLKN